MEEKSTLTTAALTPKSIKQLSCPPDKKQVYVLFVKDLYIYVSVARSGRKSLVYRRKIKGTYREKRLVHLPDSLDDAMARELIKEARAKASELSVQVERGQNPFDVYAATQEEPSLKDLFNVYIERHAKKCGRRVEVITREFTRCFERSTKLGARKASSISRDDAEKFHVDMAKERGEYAANRAVQLARAIYNQGRRWRAYTGENPFSCLTLFEEYPRDRFLTDEEAGRLFSALQDVPEDKNQRTLRDFVLLSLLTGARKSNLMSCRWEEVDLDAATWTIPPEKAKNRRGQIIPLGPVELEILKARHNLMKSEDRISEYVFPGGGKRGHLTDIKNSWTTLRNRLNIPDVRIHDLRRSLAATMASQNVNVALIKGALNHKDMKTTLHVYAQTNKRAELAARQIAHNVWLNAAKSQPPADNVTAIRQPGAAEA